MADNLNLVLKRFSDINITYRDRTAKKYNEDLTYRGDLSDDTYYQISNKEKDSYKMEAEYSIDGVIKLKLDYTRWGYTFFSTSYLDPTNNKWNLFYKVFKTGRSKKWGVREQEILLKFGYKSIGSTATVNYYGIEGGDPVLPRRIPTDFGDDEEQEDPSPSVSSNESESEGSEDPK
jgi:hypothetical protein